MLRSPLLQPPINASASSSDAKRPAIPPADPRPLKRPARSPELDSGGLRLLRLLLQCAESVAADHLSDALTLLPQISALASPFGSSPQRVASHFSDALRARILSSLLAAYSPLPPQTLIPSHATRLSRAFQILNSLTPLLQFAHFTSNQAISQTLDDPLLDRLHIVDLDIMQGLQWPALFQTLASRPRPIRSIRVTGVGPDAALLAATGRRLSDFAAGLRLPFDFAPLAGKIADLAPAPARGPGEATVAHWTQHCAYDAAGSDPAAARFLRSLRPRLVTVVEQDLCRGGDFLGRFVGALHYYSALFDAIGEGGGEGRWEVERGVFGGEIRNIVAVGGPKRTGEVTVGSWGEELRRVGFRPVSLAGSPAAQAGLLLGMVPWKGYTLVEDAGKLKLGWKDLSLLTASAWQPADVAGEGEDVGGDEWDGCGAGRVSL